MKLNLFKEISSGGGEVALASVKTTDNLEVKMRNVHNLPPVPSPRTKKKNKENKDQNIEKILQEFRSQVIEKDCEISILKQERSKIKEIVRTEIAEIRDIKNALSNLTFNSSSSNEETLIKSKTFVDIQILLFSRKLNL